MKRPGVISAAGIVLAVLCFGGCTDVETSWQLEIESDAPYKGECGILGNANEPYSQGTYIISGEGNKTLKFDFDPLCCRCKLIAEGEHLRLIMWEIQDSDGGLFHGPEKTETVYDIGELEIGPGNEWSIPVIVCTD
jgi:hypothetical protein